MGITHHYVYIIQSTSHPEHYYVGYTTNLEQRLTEHNSGKLPNTARYRPWKLTVAMAFTDREKALAFEKYLKTGSGRSFAKRHF